MGQLYSYFFPEETPRCNDAGSGTDAEEDPCPGGERHGHSKTAVTSDNAEQESCEEKPGDLCPNPVDNRSTERGNESERGTPDIKAPQVLDSPEDVDRMNMFVKCQGKTMDVDVFPLERVSILLQDWCQKFNKNPKNMRLFYNGEMIDEKKTVRDCRLRRGITVHLIHAA
ncbi:hypothetical protein MATL_G00198070 [Megalops atlanticus]|uniref:Ubiquitin-like domain-containing protein n=1 Tax=Megalops atlanticus TaxID=7932 RepID=A0A9D3PM26_MEGAT|nr:hypothetical protein MATL_G00198070 [Megalops atlanticus]